jgi:hypothetical protein
LCESQQEKHKDGAQPCNKGATATDILPALGVRTLIGLLACKRKCKRHCITRQSAGVDKASHKGEKKPRKGTKKEEEKMERKEKVQVCWEVHQGGSAALTLTS